MAKRNDVYVQHAAISVTETAANTLTFQQLTTGGMLFSRQAMVISAIEYDVDLSVIVADDDIITVALVTSNQLSDLLLSDPNVIDMVRFRGDLQGTAGNMNQYQMPYRRDYSNFPGGGVITPAHPIFLAASGTSLGSATLTRCRISFQIVELSAAEFVELVEAMRIIT